MSRLFAPAAAAMRSTRAPATPWATNSEAAAVSSRSLEAAASRRLGRISSPVASLWTSIKNADFATKKKDGYAGSDILMTQELLSIDIWDTAAIDARQRELSKGVFDICRDAREAGFRAVGRGAWIWSDDERGYERHTSRCCAVGAWVRSRGRGGDRRGGRRQAHLSIERERGVGELVGAPRVT